MSAFFLCFGQIMLYTLGVIVICGLLVEVCYQLCFSLMGRRATRVVWIATGLIGTPMHELGHAIMCLLFGHRIERVRLWPTKGQGAMVEHSYHRKNPYASFGNIWIALGPIFAGLGVMAMILRLVYPQTFADMSSSFSQTLQQGSILTLLQHEVGGWIRGLWNEQTRSLGWRIAAVVIMLSMSLHVRLSLADVKGMLRGLPVYAVLAAVLAAVMVWMGTAAQQAMLGVLLRLAWMIVLLFSLIMIFALSLFVILFVFSLFVRLIVFFFGHS